MCAELGEEPNEDEIPMDLSDFPTSFQEIFEIYSLLTDKWEGMSGVYMGKDMNLIPFLFDMYALDAVECKRYFQYIVILNNAAKKFYNDKASVDRNQRKASKGGTAKR